MEIRRSGVPVGVWEWISLSNLLILSIAVVAHDRMIDDLDAYRTSLLMPVEIISVLFGFVSVPIHFARAVYFVWTRQWRRAVVALVAALATFGIILWAMWYDAPTILYAT